MIINEVEFKETGETHVLSGRGKVHIVELIGEYVSDDLSIALMRQQFKNQTIVGIERFATYMQNNTCIGLLLK